MGAFQRLRHDYFVRERSWIPSDPTTLGIESDRYDPYCRHLAAFDATSTHSGEASIAAYLRVLPWREEVGFMLSHDFSCLLSEIDRAQLGSQGSVELSRLVVAPHIKEQGALATRQVIELLLKLLYRLSVQENWSTYYIVVEEAWLTAFTRRFHLPFTRLGQAYTFPDGTRTCAAVAYREEMEHAMQLYDSAKYRWYTER